ncbi:hypothetical protein RBH29_02945 [Herbivorax sp. ANBcel31]|uniref:hypothetical protein n=1 Tax=Herbivorax sp. ANBcel31 TaxID=3069754 RepID=UPI0027B02701|nr:hypothetical protein [Herbivorax sp. ANBcel31]MDQ2085396.1 hypothetical protein [Herbivorax sp. ANBcel31]
MAQFCTCGSLMIDEKCTNKNCSYKVSAKPSSSAKKRASSKKSTETAKEKPKTTRTRRSSKCVTYNLHDKKDEESSE